MKFLKSLSRLEKSDRAIDHIIDYLNNNDFDTDEAIAILSCILKPLVDCKRLGVLLLNRKERRKK